MNPFVIVLTRNEEDQSYGQNQSDQSNHDEGELEASQVVDEDTDRRAQGVSQAEGGLGPRHDLDDVVGVERHEYADHCPVGRRISQSIDEPLSVIEKFEEAKIRQTGYKYLP